MRNCSPCAKVAAGISGKGSGKVSSRSLVMACATAAMLATGGMADAAPQAVAEPVVAEMQKRLAAPALRIADRELNLVALKAVYAPRGHKPVWNQIPPAARSQLLDVLRTADRDGLNPQAFELPAIEARLADATPGALAEADLLLSDALMRYAAAMRGHRLGADAFDDDWKLRPEPFDARQFLAQAVKGGDPLAAVTQLVPPYAGYVALRDALARYRALAQAGGWPSVPAGPSLKPGMEDAERVPALRRRLIATGELAADQADGALMDDTLTAAVAAFQARHGLEPDGAVGPKTLAALNVPVSERIHQILANMERWRWLPQTLEPHHIVVNVAGQTMEVVKDGAVALAMRTIVGDREHHTPVFRSKVVSLVINPNWRVPASIATKEILPKLQKDPGYLLANNMRLVGDFPPDSDMAYGIGIDWKSMTSFPYSVRQLPGDDNALGQLKFNIPNSDDIYLHDTPNPRLFARADRALSHGCIRLERPEDLALHLLETGWDRPKLDKAIADGETQSLILKTRIPVYLLYFTSWAQPDGTTQFREDIYGRDKRLIQALSKTGKSKPAPVQNKISLNQ